MFALLMYFISTKLESLKRFALLYYCPLGSKKNEIKNLTFIPENIKLLNMIELSRSEIKEDLNSGLRQIAEDDEYEYYVK